MKGAYSRHLEVIKNHENQRAAEPILVLLANSEVRDRSLARIGTV